MYDLSGYTIIELHELLHATTQQIDAINSFVKLTKADKSQLHREEMLLAMVNHELSTRV